MDLLVQNVKIRFLLLPTVQMFVQQISTKINLEIVRIAMTTVLHVMDLVQAIAKPVNLLYFWSMDNADHSVLVVIEKMDKLVFFVKETA